MNSPFKDGDKVMVKMTRFPALQHLTLQAVYRRRSPFDSRCHLIDIEESEKRHIRGTFYSAHSPFPVFLEHISPLHAPRLRRLVQVSQNKTTLVERLERKQE